MFNKITQLAKPFEAAEKGAKEHISYYVHPSKLESIWCRNKRTCTNDNKKRQFKASQRANSQECSAEKSLVQNLTIQAVG
jgi:hypothetical protein